MRRRLVPSVLVVFGIVGLPVLPVLLMPGCTVRSQEESTKGSSDIRSQDAVNEKELKTRTGADVIDRLKQLPDPYDLMAQRKATSEQSKDMIRKLEEISRLPTPVLKEAYQIERNYERDNSKITNLLRSITKMTYKVEEMQEPRRFGSLLDNGQERSNWLWPLRLKDAHFELLDVEPLGSYTGARRFAADEWEYVSKRVPLRWTQEGSGEKTPRP